MAPTPPDPGVERALRKRTGLTRSERVLRARIAAAESWARTDDPRARTAAASAAGPAALTYWEAKVDPDGTLDPADRARRADHARSAHYSRMALASSKARRAKRRAS